MEDFLQGVRTGLLFCVVVALVEIADKLDAITAALAVQP